MIDGESWSDCEFEEQDLAFDFDSVRARECEVEREVKVEVEPCSSSVSAPLDVFRSEYVAEVRHARCVRTESFLEGVAAVAHAHADGEVKDGKQLQLQDLAAHFRVQLPTTAHAWTFLADKDAMTLCRELLGPDEARDFAEYLSEKVIANEAEAAKAAQKPKTGGLVMQDIIDLSRLILSVGLKDN